MTLEKQQVAGLHVGSIHWLSDFNLIFRITGNVDAEPAQDRSHQTGAVEPDGRNPAPEVRHPEEPPGIAHEITSGDRRISGIWDTFQRDRRQL
jgi:hypothetical protein